MRRNAAFLLLAISPSALLACSEDEPEPITCTKAGACTIEIVSGNEQTAQVNVMLTDPLEIQLLHNASGTRPPPIAVEWTVVSGGGGLVPDTTNTDANGAASTFVTLGSVAGTQEFKAEIAGDPDSAILFTATALPGPPKKLEAVSGTPQEAEVGTELAEPLVVRVTDEWDNPVAEQRVQWRATAGDGMVDADNAATDESGLVTAVATLGPTSGTDNNLFTATSPGLQGSARFVASALPGAASILEKASGDRQGGTRDQALPEPFVARVTDALGNPVPGVDVAFAVLSGGGLIAPDTVTTDATGTASAAATLGPEPGEHEFTATVTGLSGSPATFVGIAFPPICSADDWCWTSPVPQGNTLNGAFSLRDDHIWTVGDTGTTLRWNGRAWEGFMGGTPNDLHAVWAAAENDVWAVGEGGVLVHFDGFRWTAGQSGTNADLYAIWGASATDIWAVGEMGTIVHYDGMTWSPTMTPVTVRLNGIHGLAADDAWIVGDGGLTLKLGGGGTWETVDQMISPDDLNAVYMIATDDVWAVGDRETYLRWTGTAWVGFPSTSMFALNAVWGSGPRDVWVCGDRGRIRKFDGNRWSPEGTRTADPLYAMTPTSRGLLTVGQGGIVMRRIQQEWELEANRRLHKLQGVWGTGPDRFWAVGNSGTILEWDGERLTEVPDIPNADIIGISGTSETDVWVAGTDGFLMHYDGTAWTLVATPIALTLNGVHALSPTDVFVVGDEGTILYYDGNTVARIPAVTSARLNGVWAAARDDVWAVGDGGTVLHFDGTDWLDVPGVSSNFLLGVRGTASDDIYAFGSAGTIVHFDGAMWTPQTTSVVATIFGLHQVGPSEIWAVGSAGAILRNTGSGWAQQASGTENDLLGVYGNPGDAWAVGDFSNVLRWNP